MTAAAIMSSAMHASLRALVSRAAHTAGIEIDRAFDSRTVYPMTTITQTYKFSIHPAGESLREFVFTASLAEQSSPDGTPTAGWVQ